MKYWDKKSKRLITAEEIETQLAVEREAIEATATEETKNVQEDAGNTPIMGFEENNTSTTKPVKKARK